MYMYIRTCASTNVRLCLCVRVCVFVYVFSFTFDVHVTRPSEARTGPSNGHSARIDGHGQHLKLTDLPLSTLRLNL